MSTPETLKSSPASSPTSPSDTLLKNFRATLDQRWSEFDTATMVEAKIKAKAKLGIFSMAVSDETLQEERNKDPEFIKAKNAFDAAKSMLGSIQNDTDLKANTQVLTTVESTLKSITDHLKDLKPEEKGKAINIILAKTTADLSQFRADITGKLSDKQEAETAIAAERAIPRAVVAAAATTGGFSLISSAEAKGLVNEGTQEVKKSLKSTIANWIGFDKKTMIEDMAKQAKGESIGLMGILRVMLFSFLNKISFLGMTDDWSPEEMKLAGLTPELSKEQKKQQTREKVKNTLEPVAYASIVSLLAKKAFHEPGKSRFLAGYNQDETRQIETEKSKISALLSQPSLKGAKYSDIVTKKTTPPSGATASDMEGVVKVLLKNEAMIASIVAPYLPEWKNESLDTILSLASIHGGFLFQYHDSIESMKTNAANLDIGKAMDHIDLFSPQSPLIQTSINKLKDTEKNGFTQNIITMGFVSQKDLPIHSFRTQGYKGFESGFSGDEKLFMEKIFVFAEKILPTLYRILDLKSRAALETMFADPNKSPKLGQIMALYVLTGGKTDIGSMNIAEKTALSIAPLKFATINNDAKVSVPLMQYYSGIIMDGESFIPSEARDILRITFGEVRDAALKKMGEYTGWTTDAVMIYVKDNPGSAALWIGSFALGGMGAIRLLWGAKLFLVGGLAAAIGTKMAIADTGSTKK